MVARQSFVATFAELVVPDLRQRCRLMGHFLSLDLIDFGEAVDRVWLEASRRGAVYLPNARIQALMDWIAAMILKSEAEFRPDVLAYRAVVDRVAADIAKWEASAWDAASIC